LPLKTSSNFTSRRSWAKICAYVEDDLFLGVAARVELPALAPVGDRDLQREGGGGRRSAVERHPALDERAEHGEEATPGARDRRGVRAVLGDVPVAVEQVGPRDAHTGEVQATVVDAVQATLQPVVLAADPGEEGTLVVADGDVEAVDAVVHAVRDELREQRRRLAVDRRVAEVVLPRRPERGVDDELLRLRVVRRRRGDRRHVGSVAGLGHREGAGDVEVHRPWKERVVVRLGAEVQDRGAEEAPLHAGLDLQRRVGEHELLESGDVPAVVVGATEARREGLEHLSVLDEQLQLVEHAVAVVVHRLPLDALHLRAGGERAGGEARLRPGPEELVRERRDVEPRIRRRHLDRRCRRAADARPDRCVDHPYALPFTHENLPQW
jgi:hypothetical protein